MAKSNIITQTTSLLKEANRLTNKLGIKQVTMPKRQKAEACENATIESSLPIEEVSETVVIDTVEGAKSWLTTIESRSNSVWIPVLRQQLCVLSCVDSPTMNGQVIGNIIQCLNDSLAITTDETEKKNLRDSVTAMINNYVFLSEAKLKYAIDRNKEEAKGLLIQAGNMMSSSLSTMANAAIKGGSSVVIGNILNSTASDSNFFSKLGSFFGSKKILEEKEAEFYSFIEGIFETFDRRAELFGKSISINEMLAAYRRKLVKRESEKEIISVKSKMSLKDIDELEKVTEELADSITLADNRNILATVSGFVKNLSNVVIDKSIRKKTAQLDVHSFCIMWDSCEKNIADLKEEIVNDTTHLKELQQKHTDIGIFNFSQKKDSQLLIDEQLQTLEKKRNSLEEAERRLNQMRDLFPEAHAIKQRIDNYEANLIRIENKYL